MAQVVDIPPEPPAVSVVVPAHNEREGIEATLRAVHAALESAGAEFEILVVDDGSTDDTRNAVPTDLPQLRLLTHETNQGYGASLKTGFAAAKYDLLAFIDADATYPADRLPEMLAAARDADMVVAEREGYARHASPARRLSKAILMPLARYLTGRPIPDINSGMRIVHRRYVERYWPLLPDGFSLTTTLTMALLSAGRRVAWLRVEYGARRGRSKIRPLRDLRNFAMLILRTVTYFHPLRIYVPLSALLVLASIAVVLLSKYLTQSGQVMDVTALFLFIAGLQMLLIGVVADLVLKLLGVREP